MLKDIKGVIFDYGGTIDTNSRHWAEVLWSRYAEYHVPVDKESFREAYVFAERALAKYPFVRPQHNFHDVLSIKTKLQVEYLAEQGKLPMDERMLQTYAKQVADGCYEYVLDDIIESSVVGVRKPDPAIYRLGVEAMGYEACKVLVVGDSFSKDVVPAKQVGCPVVWLKGEGWGGEVIDESLPDVIITDLAELPALLS